MKILVTGCAGFIGYHLVKHLLKTKSNKVYGIDNLNSYYDVILKKNRLKNFIKNKNFNFYKIDITKTNIINKNFQTNNYDIVVHLAAQAGVRYSYLRPDLYLSTNITGFNNIIEASRQNNVKHFIFASSSSVYGDLKKYPYNENHKNIKPLSLYAHTKKENENLAYFYSSTFNLACTGIRFFTVYGPYGRPDMSLFSFVSNIKKQKIINLFNNGNHLRDFTYIDDAINYLNKVIITVPSKLIPFEIYNISSGKPIRLKKFLNVIEKELNIKAKIKYLGMQKGEVYKTHGDISKINKLTKYKSKTDIRKGIVNFIYWYNSYFKS